MKGKYIFIIENQTVTIDDCADIPEKFDHIIKFEPEIPPPPHTAEQHNDIHKMFELFKHLVSKEKESYGHS